MENGLKRFLSLAMAILMVFSNIPTAAFASGVEGECLHGSVQITSTATCTEAGETITTCLLCEEILSTVEAEATGHSYVDGVCELCGEADPDAAAAAVLEEEAPVVEAAPEEENSEDVNTEEENSEDVNTEEENSEDVNTEEENSEEVNTEEENSEEVNTEEEVSEEENTEEENSEEVDTEEENSEEVDTEEENSEEENTEEENSEEENSEQSSAPAPGVISEENPVLGSQSAEEDDVINTEAELAAALAADGDVVLGGDIEVTEMIVIPAGVTVTLDLAGYDITSGYQTGSDSKHIYPISNYGTLTIQDTVGGGSISGRGIYNQDGGKLTVNGVKIISEDWNGGAGIWGYGSESEIYLNDATIIGNTGVVSSEGYLEINGGTYTCYSGIKDDGSYDTPPTYNIRAYNGLKITDGTFTSRHGVISLGGGEGVIEDGSFTIEFKAAITSNVVYVCGDAELTIDDGEFISDDSADKGDSGAAVLVDSSDAKLTINDGTYVGMNGMVSINDNTVINGGSFDTVLDYNHYGDIEAAVAENAIITVDEKKLVKTANGLEEYVAPVAVVNGVNYTDIQEAIKAAAPSGTVELLSDVTVDKWVMFSETLDISSGQIITLTIDGLTIDGNGHSLTVKSIESAGNGNRLFYDATKLNIQDLTINCVEAATNQGGIGLTSGTISNVTFNGGVGVFPGTGDITITGCTFKTSGHVIYYEEARDNLKVTNNTFEVPSTANVILLRGNETFTGNTIVSGRTVNVVSGSPVVTGNDFGDVRLKVYNGATATISGNTINNLVFNDETPVMSTFGENTLSDEAKAVMDAANWPVAKIGTQGYATLQDAIDAVQNGETIVLQADCDETVTFTQTKDVSFVLDGNDKKMTGSINITARAGKDAPSTLVIKNFEFTTDKTVHDFIKSVETNYYPNNITIQNCSFTGTGDINAAGYAVVAVRLKSANNILIKDCTGTGLHSFLQNTAGWNVNLDNVDVTDSLGGFAMGTVQGTTIKNCDLTVDGMGIRLDAQYNNNAVFEDCNVTAFIPVVVRKATVDSNITVQGTNTMTGTNTDGLWCAIGTTEYKENGSLPTAATGKVNLTVTDSGLSMEGAYGYYVAPPAGSITIGYTSTTGVWGEASNANAKESYVIELYVNDTKMATSTLASKYLTGSQPLITWSIPFAGQNNVDWVTVWEEGYPNKNTQPTTVKLVIDGETVSENVVQMNGPDGVGKVEWDKLEALQPDVAEFNGTGYKTVAAALAAAQEAGVADVTITLLGAPTQAEAIALDDSFNLYTQNVFNSVTLKQEDASKVYYIAGIYTGSRANGGSFVFDGVNIVVTDQYIFEGNVVLKNNSNIKSVAEANCFIYNGTTTIEPGSKLNGVIEDFRGGDMIVDGGKTDGSYNAEPDFQDAIMVVNWSGDKLILKNGAYVKVNSANEVGRLTVNNGAAVELTASKLDVYQWIKLESGSQLLIDGKSQINTKKIEGSGKIVIDATGMTAGEVAAITGDLSGFTGTVTVTGNDLMDAKIVDGKLVLTEKPFEAQIGETKYLTLEAAVEKAASGDEIIILNDVTLEETLTLPAGITLNGGGKVINGTVKAGGDLTIAGTTTVTGFNAGWYNNTITIGEGASLKVTSGRMTVSYGNTFNITGSISDAKNADKATLTPSLELVSGISYNGDGGGVTFNVTNAYVKLGDSTTKNSGATGEFNMNFTNSIVDYTKTLKTYMPTEAGLAPEFNFTAKDSVVDFASHLELWLDNTTMTLDNTNLTVGGSFANAGTVNVTNDANFVVKAPIMSSHGGNTGTINVTGGTFELVDSNQDWENAGTIEVSGNGKLITNDFKNVGEGKLVLSSANATIVGKADLGVITKITNATVKYDEATKTYIVELPDVAQVGSTKYKTIDEAIAAWTNNTTLTLLADVTLSDVIQLKSTEHHILNLGTYTMTAASGKNAIEITCEGRSSASYALTVNADATNPGGINAPGKACIYYKKTASTKDRPIIVINNGVFDGSYSINSSSSNGGTNCPQYWINGGTFNAYMNLAKAMLITRGGYFNCSINCTGDVSAYRQFSGGTFKNWQFMTAGPSGSEYKLTVGNSKNVFDNGVYVDDNGYLVVGGPVITEAGDKFEASSTNYGGWNSNLQYSSAKDNGLYYTSVEEALSDNNKTTGAVTVYTDKVDLSSLNYKGTLIIPDGKELTVTFAEGTTPAWTVESAGEGKSVVYTDSVENGVVTRTYKQFVAVAKIGETPYESVAAALTAANDGDIITLVSGENVISMAGSVVGNKTVTITGTAIVDWTKGNLFVGRGGEGDGKVIFDGANITSYAKKSVASTGIHVSGSTSSNEVNNGVLVIKDSTIELDYLINRNETTVEGSSTLTIYGGIYTHGRAANESASGNDETATLTIGAGSTVDVKNENGMGVGGESKGIMNVAGTYKANVLNISAIGTVNVNGGTVQVTGNVNNNGTVCVTGTSDIAAAKVTGAGWVYMNGVTLSAATKLIGAKVAFINGTNAVAGSTIKDGWFSVGIGQNAAADTAAAFAAANGITLGDVTVNVSGDAVISSGGNAYNGWVGSAYSADKTQHKYVLNVENSLATFGYMHVSKDGELNVKGHATNKYTNDGANVDFYAGELIVNGEATLDGTDAWVKFTKMSVDAADGVLNIVNGTNFESSIHNGSNTSTSLKFWKSGEVNVDATSKVEIDNETVLVEGAELNVGGTVTAKGTVTGNGTITLTAVGASVTAAEGLTVTVAPELKDYKVVFENGVYKLNAKVYVAQIGEDKFESLAEAVKAVQDGQTIELYAVEFSEGTIKLPAALKNVTFKGVDGTVLKDMTIMASDGNAIDYQGLTFDGITFENSRISITGWRTGGATVKDLTVTNCTFKNLNDTTNSAPVHINMDASEAVQNFTFTNNVIDGATGGSKSGVYAQVTGKTTFTGNTINNVSFRPYVIQLTTDDGIADEFIVTGNTFSGSAAGRAQGLGNNNEGTDTVKLVVSENIFKGITSVQQICYWNFNPETTTADLSKNYYDIDIQNNPNKIYFNAPAKNAEDLIEMGIYPYYADEAMTKLVEAPAIMVTYADGTVEYFEDMREAVPHTTNYPKLEGATITLLKDMSGLGMRFMENGMVFDLNGHTYTLTGGTGSKGTETSAFQIRPEVTETATIKNGTVKLAEGVQICWIFNCYATDFIVENVTVDCTNMAWSYGESCYVAVSRAGDNVQFTGNTKVENFKSDVAGSAINVGGTMTIGENVVPGGAIELDAGATLTAPAGLTVVTVDGYVVVYENGVYKTAEVVATIGNVPYTSLDDAFAAAKDGEEVKIMKAGTYKVPTGKNITITGAVDGVEFECGQNNIGMNNASVTFNNVTFNWAANGWPYHGLAHCGEMVYNDCTFNGTVFLYGTSETFNKCEFNVTGDTYNVWTYGAKEVEFNECTFNSDGKSVLVYNEGAAHFIDVTVENSTFTASAAVDGKAAIEIDTSLTAGATITVDGATTATGFGSGNVSGNSLWNNKKGNEGVNNDITVIVNDEVVLQPIKTASIGNVYYTTIKAALDAAEAGDTVTIYAGTYTQNLDVKKAITVVGETDAEGKNLVNISGKLNITADGATVKNINVNNGSSSAGYINAKDVLVEGCSVVGGNGFRSCYTKGTVTFRDSTITGSTYGIHFDGSAGGNIVIENCDITGWTSFASTIGKVTISDSEFLKGNYNQLRFYQDAELTNVVFNPDMNIDFGKSGTDAAFNNCSVSDGSPLTEVLYMPDINDMGIDVTIDGKPVVIEATITKNDKTTYYSTLAEALAAAESGDTIVLDKDVTFSYGAREAYGAEDLTSVTIDGDGHTLTLNQTDSDWASIGLKNAEGKLALKNMTIEKTGYGDTTGAWNTHAIIFSTPVEMTDVTVNNAIAVADDATLTNVTFNEANGYYGLWIEANGQDVTVTGGSITATNGGRGIKIADEYVDAPALVNLTVDGTVFNTAKKAAVLVSSVAGADITSANVDISGVAEDTVNFAWVDEDWGEHYSKVTVTGGTVAQENLPEFEAAFLADGKVISYFKTLQEAVNAAEAGQTVTVIKDSALTETVTVPAGKTITLDLNGYTVSMETGDNAVSSLILNNGDLTIEDSSDAKSGKLSFNYTGTNSGDAYNTVETAPGSTLTVKGGTIENLSANCLIAYAIDGLTNGNIGDVTVNIEGGVITSQRQSIRIFANSTTKIGTLNITGGEIIGRVIVQNANASANKAALNITGGTFKTNAYKTEVLYVGGSNGATIDMKPVVSGGTFYGEVISTLPAGFITGGTYKVAPADELLAPGYEVKYDSASRMFGIVTSMVASVNGTDYATLAEAVVAAQNGGTIYLKRDVVLTEAVKVPENAKFTLNMMGKTLNGSILAPNAEITILNGSIVNKDSSVSAIEINAGSLTLTDVNVASERHALRIDGAVTATIEGGEFKVIGTNKGTYHAANISGAANVTIKSGSFIGPKGTKADSGAAVNVQSGATVTIEGGSFSGGKNNTLASKGTLTVTGGTYDQDPSAFCAKDYKAVKTGDKYEVVEKVYVVMIGEDGYESFEEALNAVENGETITILEGATGSELSKNIEFTKDIEFTITGKNAEYELPVITFQNATVNIKDAEILIPELDARQNATINVIDSIVHDAGGNSIVKSYYNGAINISGTSVVHTMQVTTMGYITVSGEAKLNATWQTNVYGNGIITVEDKATFTTAALQLTGKDYSGRDNTDADRVGKPAAIVVDGANLIIGKVLSDSGADYSYNSSHGINIGTIDGKSAVLDIKNGATVNVYMANGETANIGADGTVNVDGTVTVACRAENGVATLENNGSIVLKSVAATVTANECGNVTTDVADYKVVYENGAYKLNAKDYVAQIGEVKYETLAEAISYASAGDTIKLIADVTENVTINKKLTIDGGNFQYTGTMTANAGLTVAVENVNFVNGGIDKGTKSTTGNYTIKNCTFDGEGEFAYAFRFRGASSITIENCTVKDYLYSFLYVPSGTNKVSVKDVTVENCPNYAVYFSSGVNTATFENLTVKNSDNGFVINNTANRAFTIKNCKMENVTNAIAEANGTNTITCTVLGDQNDFGTAASSQYAKYVLAETTATLTAPEGKTVTTDVADYKVVYEDGAYKLVAKKYVAQIGGEKFESLQAAINAAVAGDNTIEVLTALSEDVTIKQVEGVNITIDGQNNTYSGTITIHGSARYQGEETLTIQNVHFETAEAGHYFIDSNSTASAERYAHNVTVKDCEFFATFQSDAVHSAAAMRIRQGFNITIEDVEIRGMHSLLQGYGIAGVNIDGVTSVNLKNGISLGTSTDVTIENVQIEATGYGIRADGTVASELKVAGATIEANDPIVVRNYSNADYKVALSGTNSLNGTNAEGYDVIFTTGDDGSYVAPEFAPVITGTDGLDVFPVHVAKIGETLYASLTAAIAAAEAGDKIELIADVTEDVTVNKNLTIDGADKKYTGTMTANAGLTVAVENVNFVNGGIDKGTKSTTGNYTIKNCTFDGEGKYAYAFRFRGASSITIENCTVKDYLYSFLYVPSGTNKVSVKDVTVENCPNYAVYFSSGVNTATFENLTVKNSNNGFVINNTANRAFTIKNCKMENVITAIAEANGTNTITCTVLGDQNDFGTAASSQYAKYVLAETTATLTAPEGATVTTNVEGYEVEYVDGKYVVVPYVRVAKIGDVEYKTLQAAIDAAQDGETVTLISNINIANAAIGTMGDEDYASYFVVAGKTITVDLNGKSITGTYTGEEMLVGVFSTADYGHLTLTGNGTVDIKATVTDGKSNVYALIASYKPDSSIIIENGTFTLDAAIDCLIYAQTHEGVVINGGSFTLGNVGTGNNGQPWIFNVKGQNAGYVVVNGGTFNADISHQFWANEVYVPETKALEHKNGTWTVVEAVACVEEIATSNNSYIRKIGYATLAEAISAKGTNVTILKDCELNQTWDNSYTITVNEGVNFTIAEGASIVLKTADATVVAANDKLEVTTDIADHKVVYADGVYSVAEKTYTVQIEDGEKYETLAEAIKAATAGDTIVFLADITEDVSVKKNLTIDGANFKYTGNISVEGAATAITVKNVNFVDGTGYAVTTNRIKSVTIENCTVKNYGFGFLYANKSTPTVVVKNVTVDGANYGFHWVYGTSAILENVTMTNVTYGIMTQNYGAKTITIRNSNISGTNPIYVWERNTTVVDTFKFEGANTFSALTESAQAKLVLVTADATLTAPEGYNVTTDIADHKVVYADGVYKVAPKDYVVQIGETKYESLSEAFEAAQPGDTVTVIADHEIDGSKIVNESAYGYETMILLEGKSITLDLNGKTVRVTPDTDADISGGLKNCVEAVIFLGNGANLTIKDTVGNGGFRAYKGADELYCLIYNSKSTLTIESGRFAVEELPQSGAVIYADAENTTTINGGIFSLINVGTYDNTKPWVFNVEGKNSGNFVQINGGYFYKQNPYLNKGTTKDCEVKIPEGMFFEQITSGDMVGYWHLVEAVAKIGETKYRTLQEAIDAAADGATIELLGNAGIGLVDKSLTIVRNGYKATVAALSGYTVVTDDNAYIVKSMDDVLVDATGAKLAYIDVGEAGYQDEELMSLSMALNAAKSDDTVKLIADLTGENKAGTVIIPSGVTLDIEGHTLEADYIIGLTGSKLTAATVDSNGNGSGKLIISKNGIALSRNAFVNDDGYTILPVWVDGEGYIFSLFEAMTSQAAHGFTVTDETIVFKFKARASAYTRTNLLADKGGSDHGISMKITLSWNTYDDNGKFMAVASQTFVYTDSQVVQAANNTKLDYTLTIVNYANMEIDLASLTAVAEVVSDCGAAATSNISYDAQ